MNSIKTSLLAVLILLFASCLTTPEKKPVIQGPFDSEISDTINRLSGKMPSVTGKSGQTDAAKKNQKAIHVRRNFQHYGSKRVARGDIEAEKSEILDLCCSNQKIQKALEHGITLHFDYYGKNGLYVASTVLDQKTCEHQALAKAYGKVKKRDGVYIVYSSGIVKDTQNNLEWMAGPDRNVTWDEADNWVKNLKIAGGRWRMPTLKELESLYRKGAGPRNMTPLLETTGWWVWSSETVGAREARSFSFGHAYKGWIFRGNSAGERVFAVRSALSQ